jgi:acyl carrier protein
MTEVSVDGAVKTLPQIRDWLTERVSFYLEIPAQDIDPEASLVALGLDSVYAMTLSGDMADSFGADVEPTVAWDHGTINELAAFIHGELREKNAGST